MTCLVTCGAEHEPGREHYQPASVRGTTKCIREDSSQEDETSRPLPPTPRTPGQKACTVGTNTHRSRGRPTPTYVDVLKKDAGAESTNELARCMEN